MIYQILIKSKLTIYHIKTINLIKKINEKKINENQNKKLNDADLDQTQGS